MTEMPDVNVLVALLDDLHVHHAAAKRWFLSASQTGWATCPLTISGAVRVISRPQPPRAVRIPEAARLLRALIETNHEAHTFWPDAVSVADRNLFDLARLQGYRQLTDLHLLGIAHRNGGTLVTFDGGFANTLAAVRAPGPDLLRLLTP